MCDTRKLLEEDRKVLKKNGDYFENHHIKPRCTGGTDNNTNLVLLTARDHFIVYYLLYRIVMSDEAKQKITESRLGKKNHFYGKSHSLETIEKFLYLD